MVAIAETREVARTKKGAARETPKPSDERVAVIMLKGSRAFADWLEDVHRKTHIPKTTIVRLALATWAKQNSHPAPPEF
jgi:hypothetical protein